MSSQISSGCAGTGGRDPPRGSRSNGLFTEEGTGGTRRPAALGEASVHRPRALRVGRPRRLRKTREKRRAANRTRLSTGTAQARERRSCTLARATDEAHLPAQEAQARPYPRLSCAHENPRRPALCSSAAATRAASGSPPSRWPTVRAESAAGCPAAASSSASTARDARTRAVTWSSTRFRARTTTTPTRAWASRWAASSAARSSATA